jgi:O-methyltransferase
MTATLEQIAKSALSSIETVQASYDFAWMALKHEVPGDFVECGVFAGAQCAAMALAIKTWHFSGGPPHNPYGGRRVHLFDSFSGIPQAGREDAEYLEAGHKPGLSSCSLAQVQANMKAWGIDEKLLVYHAGLFEQTVPCRTIVKDSGIALLRLDGDLYESTKICMEYLYPLLSPGGWLIVDDFDLTGSRKAVMEYMTMRFGPIYSQKQRYNWPEGK